MRKSITVAMVVFAAFAGMGAIAVPVPASSPLSLQTTQFDGVRSENFVQTAQNRVDRDRRGSNRASDRNRSRDTNAGRGRDNSRNNARRGRDNSRNNRDAFRHPSYWDRRHGRGYYNRTYGYDRRDNGSAIAAGFLGLVLGAAIAGSNRDRDYAYERMQNREWIRRCSRTYRSFDARSGTYLGYDGYRHYCQL